MISYDNLNLNTKIVIKRSDGTFSIHDAKNYADSFIRPISLLSCLNKISQEEGIKLDNISVRNAVLVEDKSFFSL